MKKPSIVTVPSPSLNNETKKVTSFDHKLKDQAKSMLEFLRKNSDYGIGLAANQLGYDNQMFVTEFNDSEEKESIPLTFFVNPKIVEKSDDLEIVDEGCLSVPSIYLPVERSKKIKIKAQNLDGKHFRLTANDLFARLLQHECDHLNGRVFTTHVREKFNNKFPEIKKLKIIFIGSGEFAEIIYRGLILLGLNIIYTITEKTKEKTLVYKTADNFKKQIIDTDNIKTFSKKIKDLSPDLIILADFGQIIPIEILNIPNILAINIHPSLLPKYRGSSPIQTAILSGENETGLSIIEMSPKIDEGKILMQKSINIDSFDNGHSLKIKLANLALKMLLEFLPKIQERKYDKVLQDNSLAILTKKIKKEDGKINWQQSAQEIDRQIRAYYLWPGSYTFIDNKRLIIHQAYVEDEELVIEIVQPEGGKVMYFDEFLRGYRGKKPDWFKKIKLEKKSKTT